MPVLVACGRGGPESTSPTAPPPPAVRLVRAHRGEIVRSITLPGNVRAWQEATLFAKVTGYLKAITVDKGDEVAAGALIADIEVPELLADRLKTQAEVEVAAINYRRVAEARKKAPDLVIPRTVDDADARQKIAAANLARIETLLGFTRITAPFAGIITRRFVDPGAFIPAATAGSTAQNAAIVSLADFSTVRVSVAVPEPDVPFITRDAPAVVTLQELPGKSFPGSVARFALDGFDIRHQQKDAEQQDQYVHQWDEESRDAAARRLDHGSSSFGPEAQAREAVKTLASASGSN